MSEMSATAGAHMGTAEAPPAQLHTAVSDVPGDIARSSLAHTDTEPLKQQLGTDAATQTQAALDTAQQKQQCASDGPQSVASGISAGQQRPLPSLEWGPVLECLLTNSFAKVHVWPS